MAEVIPGRDPGPTKRKDCLHREFRRLRDHEEGSYTFCTECERWVHCRHHYTYTACITKTIRWWHFADKRAIAVGRRRKEEETDE